MRATVLTWSPRYNQVWHAPMCEAESAIVAALGAETVALSTHRFSRFVAPRLRARFDPVPPLRLTPPSPERADVGIALFPNGSVVRELVFAPEWRRRADRWVAVVPEFWPRHMVGQEHEIEEVLSQFEAIAVMTAAGAEALNARFPRLPVRFAPFAVDARACTVRRPGARGVTVFNPGRRDPTQHNMLLNGLGVDELYLFDTFAPGRVPDLAAHRSQYLNTIAHTRVMVTNYAKFDQPSETNGVVEVGLRLTEALSCGAVPMGHHPATIEMTGLDRSWFGPFIPVGPADASESLDAVRDVLVDHELGERVAFEGPRFIAGHHDWSHRVAELFVSAGIDVPQSLFDYQARLLERLK